MVNVFLMFLMVTFAGLSQGASGTNTSTVLIKAYVGMFYDGGTIKDYITSLLTAAQLIGCTIGSFSCSFLIDKVGPKWLVIVCGIFGAVTQAIGIIRTNTTKSLTGNDGWVLLFVMRMLNGIPAAIIATVTSAWMAEYATVKQRGFIGVMYQIAITFGIVINSLLLFSMTIPRNFNNYWIILIVTVIIFVICTILAFFLPDSKFRCCKKGTVVQTTETHVEQVQIISWKTLFTDKRYRKSLLLGSFFAIGQQFSGINAVINYATITFQDFFIDEKCTGATLDNPFPAACKVTKDQSSNYGQLVIQGVNFLSVFIAIPLIAKVGRKPLTIAGFMIDNICLLILAIIYFINNDNPQKIVLIVASIVYIIGFEIAPGPLYYVCCSESFPPECKGKVLGFAFTMVQLSFFIVVYTFPPLQTARLVGVAYIMYFIVTQISTIILWVIMVETRGKTFEEIEAVMTGEARSNVKSYESEFAQSA